MKLDRGDLHLERAERIPADVAETWAREWPSWFDASHRPLPNAPGRAHLALGESPLGPVVAKRERSRGLKRLLERLGLRSNRSVRAWHAARALGSAGVPTPEILACIQRRGADALLVMEYIDGLDPWTFLRRGNEKSELLQALAETLRRLHGAGWRHRDLKAPNVLLRTKPGGSLEALLVDWEGVSRPRRISRAVRIRDLARLCASFEAHAAREVGISPEDWERLVASYLGGAADADFAARTRAWARDKQARNQAAGRPLS